MTPLTSSTTPNVTSSAVAASSATSVTSSTIVASTKPIKIQQDSDLRSDITNNNNNLNLIKIDMDIQKTTEENKGNPS